MLPGIDESTFKFEPTFENQIRVGEMTEAQREVAELLVEGLGSHDIARELGTTFRTVKCHLNQLYKLYKIDTDRWSGGVRLAALLMLPVGSKLREQLEATR